MPRLWFTLRDVCPECGSDNERFLERMMRRIWMRLVPWSRLYLCKNCHTWFLVMWPSVRTEDPVEAEGYVRQAEPAGRSGQLAAGCSGGLLAGTGLMRCDAPHKCQHSFQVSGLWVCNPPAAMQAGRIERMV